MHAHFNLLDEAILTVDWKDGRQSAVTLPMLLAGLCDGSLVALGRIAAHQRQAAFCFLTQLAAIALNAAGGYDNPDTSLPTDASQWRTLLRQLTADYPDDEPWCLVVEDCTRPAFLQPAVRSGRLDQYKKTIDHPDLLDVLVTSKNHDVKRARIGGDDPELWLYALLTLQTMQGFLGAGNQGIARMNGGFGSRCFISRAPGLALSERFQRDLRVLLADRGAICERYSYPNRNGIALLWLEPWDDDSSIPLDRMDPFFIEICRRIRLAKPVSGETVARFRTSDHPRLEAKAFKGNIGDPWIPINSDGAALTVPQDGFTTRSKVDILFGGETILRQPDALAHHAGIDSADAAWFIGSVLVRGQGKTEGLHEFTIPIPAGVSCIIQIPDGRTRFGQLSRQMLEHANAMRLRVFRPAVLTFLQAGRDNLDFRDDHDRDWRDRFTQLTDERFFPHLWRYADASDDGARMRVEAEWISILRTIAYELLRDAMTALPAPVARRVEAEAMAELKFEHYFAHQFGNILTQIKEMAA